MGNTRLEEVGFSDFTTLLITETLNAVITSQIQQEEKIQELNIAVAMSLEEFSKAYISDDEVKSELARLFTDPGIIDGKSSVEIGMPYVPAGENNSEMPRVREICGYDMIKGDYIENINGYEITEKGYKNISRAVLRRLASLKQEGLRYLVSRGIPRVLVDNGKVSAKLTMRIEEQKETSKSSSKLLGSKNDFIGGKLVVRPVNVRGPEYLTIKTDITSEVEINFKTIVL